MTGLIARLRSYWRGLRHRGAIETDMAEEFRYHLELRTADLVGEGVTPEQAARQARLEFGHVEGHLMDARAARGFRPFDQLRFSALDVRLGVRMLAKYPGLSLIAVTGMALAIAIGVGVFSLVTSVMETTLPLPAGDRVVAVRNTILTEPGQSRATLRDFLVWREELESVEDLAAFTMIGRNLQLPGAGVHLVRVVRMTASGFDAARTAPLLGRPLRADDERSDARVVVIGHEEWQRRFVADPRIIGRQVRLGTVVYTIVGVMPEGFRFPLDDGYWVPLVFGPEERAREAEVALTIVGRLADGATFESAQAELDNVGVRMAAAHPETHEQLRPQVLHYTRAYFDLDSPQIVRAAQLFRLTFGLLMVVVAVNVAVLVYARTATRAGEIAVRTALGASRARVVTQLFAEALVLSVAAAVIGVTIAGVAIVKLHGLAEVSGRVDVPFWIEPRLSPGAALYALALVILGGVIVGVLPALKVTGRRVHANLQQLAGRGTQLHLGRAWTTLIIAQVAIAVAVLPFALHLAEEAAADAAADPGYAAEEFLEASIAMEDGTDRAAAAGAESTQDLLRFQSRALELIRRLETDPAVAGLTIRMAQSYQRVEVEDAASSGAERRPIVMGTERIEHIEPGFFALYDLPMVAGRSFDEADARAAEAVVIVNHVFVEKLQRRGHALGQRLRFVRESETTAEDEAGPWLEVVGVVRDFQANAFEPQDRIYLPADITRLSSPITLALRMRVSPVMSYAPQLREAAAAVDPALLVRDIGSASQHHRDGRRMARYLAIGTSAVMLSVLLLSAAGIYAMMSFTVTRRRREIGIRAALGADARWVLSSIFARASMQLFAGILFGLAGTYVLDRLSGKGPVRDGNLLALAGIAALMAAVGLLATLGPARRGLAIQPTEALRTE